MILFGILNLMMYLCRVNLKILFIMITINFLNLFLIIFIFLIIMFYFIWIFFEKKIDKLNQDNENKIKCTIPDILTDSYDDCLSYENPQWFNHEKRICKNCMWNIYSKNFKNINKK